MPKSEIRREYGFTRAVPRKGCKKQRASSGVVLGVKNGQGEHILQMEATAKRMCNVGQAIEIYR